MDELSTGRTLYAPKNEHGPFGVRLFSPIPPSVGERLGDYALIEKAATGQLVATTCPIIRLFVRAKGRSVNRSTLAVPLHPGSKKQFPKCSIKGFSKRERDYFLCALSLSSRPFSASSFSPASPSLPSAVKRW